MFKDEPQDPRDFPRSITMFNLGIKAPGDQSHVISFLNDKIHEARQLGRHPFDEKHTYQFHLNKGREDINQLHHILQLEHELAYL
jgi:hypothetical protein